MADRYWVGNGGNWSDDDNHWATSSGGSPANGNVPTSADDVYFDENSFSSGSQIVTTDVNSSCKNLDWTNVTNTPQLRVNSDLLCYGSAIFVSGMTAAGSGYFKFQASSGSWTWTMPFSVGWQIDINNSFQGTLTLLTNITTTGTFFLHQGGTVNVGNFILTTPQFTWNGSSSARTLNLQNGIVICSNLFELNGTNGNIDPGNSVIILTGANGLRGGGNTLNEVWFTATTSQITGSNTIRRLKINPGKTLRLTAGTTQTILELVARGDSGSVITINSLSGGSPATLLKDSGYVDCDWLSVQDIAGTGGAVWYMGNNSSSVSGNSGLTFTAPPSYRFGKPGNLQKYLQVGGGMSRSEGAR